MTREELDILNDYLKTLSVLQEKGGMKLNSEINLVVKEINKKLGLEKGSITIDTKGISITSADLIVDSKIDLSSVSTDDLFNELGRRGNYHFDQVKSNRGQEIEVNYNYVDHRNMQHNGSVVIRNGEKLSVISRETK